MSPFPLLRRLWLVLAVAFALAGCDCGRECTEDRDCTGQGPSFVCQAGRCVDVTPDSGPQCSPACATNQFCETATLTCKNCDATRGCTGTQVCDTAANGGAGQCRACAPSTDGGVAPGCSFQLPACDPAAGGGSGQCVRCTAASGCGAGLCDTSVAGGVCRACFPSTDGGAVAPGCTAPEPICNPQQDRCITCNATAGCAGDQAVCDQAANGGKGTCRTCVVSTDGGAAPGCGASNPVCDPAADGGTGTCVVCSSAQGCTAPQFCDTAALTGLGQCKSCVDSTDGGRDPGCTSGAPVCNTAADGGVGTCLGCIVSGDCTVDPNRVCDPVLNTCKICILVPAPEGCSATQLCDPAANGGQGACLGCGTDQDCRAGTPRCIPTPPPGQCVECVGNPDCSANRPVCNASNVCGCTASAECVTDPNRVCDPAANSGNGECVRCTATEGCTDPNAPTCSNGQCVCTGNPQCDVNETCTGTVPTCQADDPAPGSAGIAAFRAAAAGTVAIDIPGVYVTYLKPPLGSAPNDVPGFFVQAEANGPAMFVSVDPATLVPPALVGDRVTFQATTKVFLSANTSTASIDTASAITGWTLLSSDHPVQNLNTASPAGLTVDRSLALDLVTGLEGYESELIRLTGNIAGPFSSAGTPHLAAQLNTAGVPGNANLQLRLPDTLVNLMELGQGCRVTLTHGPMWRFTSGTTNRAQPSAYGASDLQVISCPAPRAVSAASLSATSVEVLFDRSLDPATIQPTDFAVPGLTVSDAVLSGRKVTLTTGAQTQDQSYTVTVTGVADTYGTPIDPAANTASFLGYAAPSASAGLLINEIDYDQVGTDSTEFVELVNTAAGPVSLGGVELVLVSGGTTGTPRREYARYRLDRVTDGANPVLTVPAGGVVVVGAAVVVNVLPPGALRMAITTPTGAATNLIQNGGITGALESDGVGLIHYATGTRLDSLFYEDSTQGSIFDIATGTGDQAIDFLEGTRTSAFDSGAGSLERRKAGMPAVPQDTGNNDADFALLTASTPGTP